MFRGQSTALIIPVLDEADTIGSLLDAVDRSLVDSLIVVDNGSTDGSDARAREHGARVFHEPRRGYGSACLRGLDACRGSDIVLFMDGDGSDDPTEIPLLLEALHESGADMVIGSRTLGDSEPGALSPVQRFGNALTCSLLRLFWKQRATDLGPFRAIRRRSLDRLAMADPDFGWTIEMQVKAAQQGLLTVEVPVSYGLRRGGKSKVSGTILGSWHAGRRILGYVFAAKGAEIRLALRLMGRERPPSEHLLLFTRFPHSGQSKTRLIPALGAEGAAALQARLTEHAAAQARALATLRGAHLIVCHADGDEQSMAGWLGADLSYRPQSGADLGARMVDAFREVFIARTRRAVIMGSDCPALNAAMLAGAFTALVKNDVVLGPAADGGYTLIGMRRENPGLFDGIEWGGPDVLAETLLRARRGGLSIALLDTLHDIDRPEDLEHAAAFLPARDLKQMNAG